jgi:RimJ/RimL family protein N-acetyltransferase
MRLTALRESPTAFASSDDEERNRSLADMQKRLGAGDPAGVLGAFSDDDRLIGMLGFAQEERQKRRHIGWLSSLFVAPDARRQGIARALTVAAIDHARRLPALRLLLLSVTAGNEAARRLYLSLGFAPFGVEPEALFVASRYLDMEHLALKLPHDS